MLSRSPPCQPVVAFVPQDIFPMGLTQLPAEFGLSWLQIGELAGALVVLLLFARYVIESWW